MVEDKEQIEKHSIDSLEALYSKMPSPTALFEREEKTISK